MSDDTSQAFLDTGRNDPELQADNARFAAAQNEDESTSFLEAAKTVGAEVNANRAMEFLLNVPRNVGVGAWHAILNTADTASDLLGQGAGSPTLDVPSLSEAFPDFWKSAHAFADNASVVRFSDRGLELSAETRPEDALTEGISQFALPFAGWLKAFGGFTAASKVVKVTKAVAAEGTAAASAFDPHEGRLADLLQYGQQMENRFGSLLRAASPDGSLANDYINWITAREGEGKWEGRFKNAVDSLTGTAAIGGVIYASGKAYRSVARKLDKKSNKVKEVRDGA